MPFQLKIRSNEALEVKPSGDLDINSASELKTAVLEAYQKEPSAVVFDFSNLEYLDSTGLGALISILKMVKPQKHTITIQHAKSNVKKLFTITELDRDFILED